MRKLLIVFPILAACASPASAQSDDAAQVKLLQAQIRLLRAENTLLKSQMKTLKTKLAAGATTRPSGTFTIQEDDSAWWGDPEALVFQVRLREILARRMPDQAPMPWTARNKYMAGKELSWTTKILSVRAVTESTAGQQVWNIRRSIENQKKQVQSLKQQVSRTADPASKDGLMKSMATAELRLAQSQAEKTQWQRILDFKGGALLQAGFREKRGTRSVDVLSVKLALRPKDADRLKKYQDAKRAKYSDSGSRYGRRDESWPVRITGKIDSMFYDGTTVLVSVDGKWFEATGDGRAKPTKPPLRKTLRARVPVAPARRPGNVNVRH